MIDVSEWMEHCEQERKQKDNFFRLHPKSPIPFGERKGFQGLDYHRDLITEGKYILDLNRACNPWCAYSVGYVCPFVPQENWLKAPVYAGEKNYHGKKG